MMFIDPSFAPIGQWKRFSQIVSPREWSSFAQYKSFQHHVAMVSATGSEASDIRCTCAEYGMTYYCQHAYAYQLAKGCVQIDLLEIPFLSRKRGRGRPPKLLGAPQISSTTLLPESSECDDDGEEDEEQAGEREDEDAVAETTTHSFLFVRGMNAQQQQPLLARPQEDLSILPDANPLATSSSSLLTVQSTGRQEKHSKRVRRPNTFLQELEY
jgi:hypothetical protein